MKYLSFSIFLIIIVGCSSNEQTPTISNPIEDSPNILLIIADDLGKDALSGFSEGTIKPFTPNLDAIRNSGLTFNNFWSYPTCSPTRAAILTGKYGHHTDVKWAGDEINLSETILQTYINQQTNNRYSTAVIGKWHLSGNSSNFNPESLGIDYYAGLIRGEAQSYYNWMLTENGNGQLETEYSTTKFTQLAKTWISEQDKPWFLWLAYNAPHTPFHNPPNVMHSQGNLPEFSDGMEATPYYMAAIEAMDYQIGELLESIPTDQRENTVILFLGDNGTPNEVVQSPYSFFTAKGSLNQGGINVPMFIAGKGVSKTGIENSLINSTDLFATISQIAGVNSTEIHDSKSFKSLLTNAEAIREYQYSEKDDGTNQLWTISNGSYKLIENANGNQQFYFLENDPYEQNHLPTGILTADQYSIKLDLESEIDNIRQ
ncbi:MAG: sulfatase [Bacteroidetes bacterium MedPE-SWsnd-G2]|nr:MAG: sulfatase [Bacteroidetes bacterium MedPE-SWsnd-G2]